MRTKKCWLEKLTVLSPIHRGLKNGLNRKIFRRLRRQNEVKIFSRKGSLHELIIKNLINFFLTVSKKGSYILLQKDVGWVHVLKINVLNKLYDVYSRMEHM